ncbi:hypothetical protein U0070_003582 [Myodes glareolus]|uniref:Uncharacterized protein n=1 Tax=Myodes glareolus TaxID=447135 RepID=A0AAW0J0U7_MYOGA
MKWQRGWKNIQDSTSLEQTRSNITSQAVHSFVSPANSTYTINPLVVGDKVCGYRAHAMASPESEQSAFTYPPGGKVIASRVIHDSSDVAEGSSQDSILAAGDLLPIESTPRILLQDCEFQSLALAVETTISEETISFREKSVTISASGVTNWKTRTSSLGNLCYSEQVKFNPQRNCECAPLIGTHNLSLQKMPAVATLEGTRQEEMREGVSGPNNNLISSGRDQVFYATGLNSQNLVEKTMVVVHQDLEAKVVNRMMEEEATVVTMKEGVLVEVAMVVAGYRFAIRAQRLQKSKGRIIMVVERNSVTFVDPKSTSAEIATFQKADNTLHLKEETHCVQNNNYDLPKIMKQAAQLGHSDNTEHNISLVEADEVVDCVHEFQLLSLEDAVVGGGSRYSPNSGLVLARQVIHHQAMSPDLHYKIDINDLSRWCSIYQTVRNKLKLESESTLSQSNGSSVRTREIAVFSMLDVLMDSLRRSDADHSSRLNLLFNAELWNIKSKSLCRVTMHHNHREPPGSAVPAIETNFFVVLYFDISHVHLRGPSARDVGSVMISKYPWQGERCYLFTLSGDTISNMRNCSQSEDHQADQMGPRITRSGRLAAVIKERQNLTRKTRGRVGKKEKIDELEKQEPPSDGGSTTCSVVRLTRTLSLTDRLVQLARFLQLKLKIKRQNVKEWEAAGVDKPKSKVSFISHEAQGTSTFASARMSSPPQLGQPTGPDRMNLRVDVKSTGFRWGFCSGKDEQTPESKKQNAPAVSGEAAVTHAPSKYWGSNLGIHGSWALTVRVLKINFRIEKTSVDIKGERHTTRGLHKPGTLGLPRKTSALIAAPYVSQNGSEECKGEENCHCTASARLPCLLQSSLFSSDL